jgi:protein-S-isoprenylcysteine O-methyltransferase Ste14
MQQRASVIMDSGTKIACAALLGHVPLVGYVVVLAGLLLFAGVILPAVWSSRPERRRDARAVLRLLLHTLRHPLRR